MNEDKMDVEILEDGTIKWSTDKVSNANHSNAENFLADVQRAAGGKVDVKRKGLHTHVHGTVTHSH